jgi:aryl-alcohol dehydrogenase-like predicted oxidoreductase
MRFDTAAAASRALPSSPTSSVFVFVFVVIVVGTMMLSSSSPSFAAVVVVVSAAYSGSSPIVKNVAVPGLRRGMDYCKLGTSDLLVSKVCMGTMTYGKQNTLEEGVRQLDVAFDEYGVNFIDTAEIYPTPPSGDTLGLTDKTISSFLKRAGGRRREDVILATKVAGPGVTWLPRKDPDTPSRLTRGQILRSVDESLKRLGTDYVDLLQLHWPDRYAGGLFGQPDFTPSLVRESAVPFDETLGALQSLVESGKVRHVGVSNETPYGVCTMIGMAESHPEKYPRIVSIQNSYSLVVRKDYESGLAEACHHHRVGLLPYSPLAGGSLTNKYADRDNLPPNSRYSSFPGYMARYYGSQNEAAVRAYAEVAAGRGMKPGAMALSWCYHREHVCSTIIGATSLDQLRENIRAYDTRLDDEILKEIDGVYKRYTDPTKYA